MANTFTNALYTMLATKALEAFVGALTPLRAFATNFSEATVQRGDKVKVLFVDAASVALDFTDPGTYTIQDSTAQGLDITINRRKYVSWHLTTEQMANNPQITLDRFARQKGYALAKAVFQDVLSLVTLANYGAAGYTGTTAGFDADDVADLEVIADNALWPEMDRSLIISPALWGSLVKGTSYQFLIGQVGLEKSNVLMRSAIPELHKFGMYKSPIIPANAEGLNGLAVHPDAILCAMRVLQPDPNQVLNMFEVLTDPESGISITLREWYDPDKDQTNRVLECNYGRRTGNLAACKRIAAT